MSTIVNHSDVLRHAQRCCAPSRCEKHALCARKGEFDLAENYKFGTVGARRRDSCRQQDGKAEILDRHSPLASAKPSEADQVVPSLFILASFSANMHQQ